MSYTVTIGFNGGGTWKKSGIPLEEALDIKTYFLEKRSPRGMGKRLAREGEAVPAQLTIALPDGD